MNDLFYILLKVGISERDAFDMVKGLENGLTVELIRVNDEQRELLLQIKEPYLITENERSIEIKKLRKCS